MPGYRVRSILHATSSPVRFLDDDVSWVFEEAFPELEAPFVVEEVGCYDCGEKGVVDRDDPEVIDMDDVVAVEDVTVNADVDGDQVDLKLVVVVVAVVVAAVVAVVVVAVGDDD